MNKELLKEKLEKPHRTLYIKLGTREAGWEADCIKNNKISVGFQLHVPEVLAALKRPGSEKFLSNFWEKKGKTKGTSTRFVNEMFRFYEDDGNNTLWVTFANEKMYYCFSNGEAVDNAVEPTFRKTDENGWICKNIEDKELSIHSLSSALTKTRGTQNTIPDSFSKEIQKYIKGKILGLPFEPLERASMAKTHLGLTFEHLERAKMEKTYNEAIKELIKSLHQDDFELLIEIIFSKTKWLRTSSTGGNQKTIDFAVRNFEDETEAFVQVKTKATQNDENGFTDYVERLIGSPYKKMFFIYHSTHSSERVIYKDSDTEESLIREEKEVEIWDLDRVFEEVCKHKLQDWILWAARRC